MQKIYGKLYETFSDYSYQKSNDILSKTLSTLKKSDIQELLCSSVNEAKLNQDLLDSSYFHPNGFSKLVLMRCPKTNFILRLHTWDNVSDQNSITKIHTHTRDAWSLVLKGDITDTRYSEIAEPEDCKIKLYKTKIIERDTKAAYEFLQGGRVYLRELGHKTHQEGQVYGFQSDILHSSTTPKMSKNVTLFLQSPSNVDYAYSYTKHKRITPENTPAFNLQSYQDIVSKVLDWI